MASRESIHEPIHNFQLLLEEHPPSTILRNVFSAELSDIVRYYPLALQRHIEEYSARELTYDTDALNAFRWWQERNSSDLRC